MSRLKTFLKNICCLKEVDVKSASSIEPIHNPDTDAVIYSYADSVFHSESSREHLRNTAHKYAGIGFGTYISFYEFSNSTLLTVNDNFIQRYQPKQLYFIKDEMFKDISESINCFVKESALENISYFSDTKLKVSGFVNLPEVSIVITNYNYAKYINECIESVIEQDYPYIQRIVVDDCSSDSSPDIISLRADAVQVIRCDRNGGQLKSMFVGLQECTGEFVVYVDADDLLDSRTVSGHLYVHLFQKQNVAFTCVRNSQISEKGSMINDYHLDFASHDEELVYIRPRVIHTPTWSWSTTSAMMFRTDTLRLIKTENTESFRICADYYLVHFANLLGGSMLFNKSLANYRRHGKNNFSKNMIIGGHRPTGHSERHSHPEHILLQKAIVGHLLDKREVFEPYFASLPRYAETMGYAMEPDSIMRYFDIDIELRNSLSKVKKAIRRVRRRQIRKKKIVIFTGNLLAFGKSLKIRINSYIKTNCEK